MKFTAVIALALGSMAAWPQSSSTPDFEALAQRAAAALEKHPEEAAGLYRQAVALRPSWAEGWFYLGASEYELKHYEEARRALARAAELAADNGAAWALLGLSEDGLGEYAQALAHIVKAEGLGLPDNPRFIETVRLRAAVIAMRSADFTGSIEQLRPLAMSGDQSPAAIEALGMAALTMPYPPDGILADKRALVDLAGHAAWSFYGQHWAEADALFKQLGDQYGGEPGVHYLRGIYYVDRDMPAALAEFAQELKISPGHVMARVQIAILHLRNGEAAAALDPAQEAVKLAPGNLLCHLALGRALLDLDKTPAAIQEFETAAKINPAYPHTHFYLSQAYGRAGRDKDARREQQEFTRLKAAGSPTAGAGLPLGQRE